MPEIEVVDAGMFGKEESIEYQKEIWVPVERMQKSLGFPQALFRLLLFYMFKMFAVFFAFLDICID
jgi:hypothetical protein